VFCAIDVGNTHTVLGLFEGETLIESWRLRSDKERTADEWGINFNSLFSMRGLSIHTVSAAAVASVVPPATHAVRQACVRYFGVEPLIVGPGVKTGVSIRYENPREVGADRIVNAVAGYDKCKRACIVVDFGTATTFDCISADGEYLGGAITPGIATSLDALASKTSKLPRVEIGLPRHAIGRNTVESIQSGVLFGYVSLVDGMVKRLSKEMGGSVAVIATGGLAEIIAHESEAIEQVDANLTLNGLRLIFALNQAG
jgi:type III pantothenate kinase